MSYKRNGLQGWWFLSPIWKNLPKVIWIDLLTNIKCVKKKWARKLAVTTTSAHTHAYHYPLLESGTKTNLWTIVLCREDIKLTCKYKE